MSQSSNSTMNTNIFSDLSAITANNPQQITSTGTERGKKRPTPLTPEDKAKKRVANHDLREEGAVDATSKSIDQPKFVSAAEIAAKTRTSVQVIPEISDAELLEMSIKFEKEHPQ